MVTVNIFKALRDCTHTSPLHAIFFFKRRLKMIYICMYVSVFQCIHACIYQSICLHPAFPQGIQNIGLQ